MANQLRLFPKPKPSKTAIKQVVQELLQDFTIRQAARDERRKKANESQRSEVRKLKRRVRF